MYHMILVKDYIRVKPEELFKKQDQYGDVRE